MKEEVAAPKSEYILRMTHSSRKTSGTLSLTFLVFACASHAVHSVDILGVD